VFILIGALVFTFIIAVMTISRRSQVFKERLRASEAARALLKEQNLGLEADIVALRARERGLQDQVNQLIAERDNLKSLAVRSGSSRPKTVVDVLLNAGRITPEGLQKATDYKKKTRSPYSIEEILVLLDQANVEDIRAAKRQLGES
jgi:hypothetical protein